MSHRIGSRWLATLGAALTLTACSDAPTAPPAGAAAASAVKFWEVGATVAWNQIARDVSAARGGGTPITTTRLFAYLSIAQYNAAVAARAARADAGGPSVAAAVAGASAVLLERLFPLDVALLEGKLAQELAEAQWPGDSRRDVAAGVDIGRTVGDQVAAYAAGDGFPATTLPVNPRGPGNWTGAASIPGLYGVRPLTLASQSQFRPGPPPALDSPEFAAALKEVEDLTITVDPAFPLPSPANFQLVLLWATRGPAFLNGMASGLIASHHLTEIEAARALALANIALFDATVGCFDAKLAYYFIRPVQVNNAIPLSVAMPNHPSYPSGHSCQTASFVTALASVFPAEREALEALVIDAGLSRMYAGLHFRFDCEAGQEIGRNVAEWVMRTAPNGHAPIPLD